MSNDPGLAGDSCIFMEAIGGDGGVHNSHDTWWLSPDINLTGPVSGLDKADPGQVNPVAVKLHRKAAASNCTFPGSESVTVQLWVANPSLAMTPDNPASAALAQSIGTPVPVEGATAVQVIDWTPPQGLPATDPQSSGHKCLIARCYADSLTPDPHNFFVPDDPHVAQHNICIVPCGGPGAAVLPGPCGFNVTTVNPNRLNAQSVKLHAVVDLHPNDFVRNIVLKRLHSVSGFHQLATAPPHGFKFEFPHFPNAVVADHSHPPVLPKQDIPSFEVTIHLAPAQLVHLKFIADLTGAHHGDAFIFHLTQTGADLHAQGGLTLVMVAV